MNTPITDSARTVNAVRTSALEHDDEQHEQDEPQDEAGDDGVAVVKRDLARSQALVEFAVIAPLFFALFVGLADMGRGLLAYTELAMGSRAAARQAVLQYNIGSNITAGCSSPCQAPGVVPTIRKQAGFGFPLVYNDSATVTTVPANAVITNDPNWTANGDAPPYDISLTNAATANRIYVFTESLVAMSKVPATLPA